MPRLRPKRLPCILTCVAIAFLAVPLRAEPPAKPAVHGELLARDGVRVLRVWGDPRQRGEAHGRLLARDIVDITDRFIRTYRPLGGPKGFNQSALLCTGLMTVQPQYEAELRGIITGVHAALDDQAVVPVLKRKIAYPDLLTLNAFADLGRIGCSSFAAWGDLTERGDTLAGRNLDWLGGASDALTGREIVIAQIPLADHDTGHNSAESAATSRPADGPSAARPWVSITWPGLVICLTGMNADGVTVCMHDSGFGKVWLGPGSTPRGFALREALEVARPESILADVGGVLRARKCVVGNNVPVAWPHRADQPASVVFEYDGDRDETGGVTFRAPSADAAPNSATNGEAASTADCQVCTNHYRARAQPRSCDRYAKLDAALHAAAADRKKITLDQAWAMLDAVAVQGHVITYHSVVFEPNQRRLHVAFFDGRTPAPRSARHTLNVAELLTPPKGNGGQDAR